VTAAIPALELQQVTRAFGGLRAVEGVTLGVPAGERRALIGPNGAGKTTLFNLITGELPVSAGSVRLFGRDVTRAAPHRRAALGLARTFQITNLFPTLTALECCLLAVQARTPARLVMWRPVETYRAFRERAADALAAVGLVDRARAVVGTLSHGEQRQLEIGVALAAAPRMLLLDEPTAGLSGAESLRVAGLIRALPASMTVLIIEHDMDLVLDLTDRVTVLHYGRVIAEGTPDTVKGDPLVREVYLGA
jgi:branched-chain amino acid transport system ATP-binding protein